MATQQTGIEVLAIIFPDQTIQYYCHSCQKQGVEKYEDWNPELTWYKFTCEGCEATRTVQLGRFIVP